MRTAMALARLKVEAMTRPASMAQVLPASLATALHLVSMVRPADSLEPLVDRATRKV